MKTIKLILCITAMFLGAIARAQNITDAEYFFNTDPGQGNGIPLNTFPLATSFLITQDISFNNLPYGQNFLHVRAKDEDGKWSEYQFLSFYIHPDVTSAEYFFDIDPGQGNGTAIPVSPDTEVTLLNQIIDLAYPCLSAGTHNLYFRFKDASNKWGMYTSPIPFTISSGNGLPFTTSVTPVSQKICNGSDAILTSGSPGNGYNFLWGGNAGNATTQSVNITNITANDTYSVVVTDAISGCKATASGIVNVSPAIVFGPQDIQGETGALPSVFCGSQVTVTQIVSGGTLNNNGNYVHALTGGSGIISAPSYSGVNQNTATFSISGLDAGTYTFTETVTDNTGCQNSIPVTFTVNEKPVAPEADNVFACENALPALLTAIPPQGSTVDWYSEEGMILLSGNNSYNTSEQGTYFAKSRNTITGCASTNQKPVSLTINTVKTWYRDADNDGYYSATQSACDNPGLGWTSALPLGGSGDCNDNDAAIHPGATEICGNGIDDNCNGVTDEGCTLSDADGDGYTTEQGDCNDNNAAIHPGATEICGNGIDDNCNGQIDETCLPGISINDNRLPEGSICTSSMKFVISLNHPYTDTVKVRLRTADSTATAGSDYIANSGIIKFLPGQTSKHIYAIIFGDPRPEKNEKFKIILSNPVNAIITDSIGIGTILNDDEVIISAQEDAHPNAEDKAVTALQDISVKVWPNPATSLLNLQTAAPFTNNISVQLMNVRGSIVKQWKLPLLAKQTVHQLNIEEVANGTYMLVIKDNSGNKKTEKIIILK